MNATMNSTKNGQRNFSNFDQDWWFCSNFGEELLDLSLIAVPHALLELVKITNGFVRMEVFALAGNSN